MFRFLAHHELLNPSHSSRGLCVNCDEAYESSVHIVEHPKTETSGTPITRGSAIEKVFGDLDDELLHRVPRENIVASVDHCNRRLVIRESEWVSERRRNIIHGCSTKLRSQSSWEEGNRYLGHGPCTMSHVLINECRMSSNDAVEWLECSRRRKHQTSEFTKTEASGVSIGN